MFKIGDFSKLSRVSIRMLRHYDQIGLFKPAYIDPESSYRYYAADQLPRLNRILALKDLGFPLEQIASLLEENVTADEIRRMRPFGTSLQSSLDDARVESGGWAVWEEEDYCSPPLDAERAAVLDTYFTDLKVEKVTLGKGWDRIDHLARLWKDGQPA